MRIKVFLVLTQRDYNYKIKIAAEQNNNSAIQPKNYPLTNIALII